MPERPFADVCSGAVTVLKLLQLQLPPQQLRPLHSQGTRERKPLGDTAVGSGADPCGGSGAWHGGSAASGGSGEARGSAALTCQVQLQRAGRRSADQCQFGHHHIWGVGI